MIAEQENRTTSEQDSHAGMIADDFDRSMTRSDGAYYLSNGLYVLQNHATRDAPAISIKASNRLLQKCQELMAVWPPLMTDLLRAKAAEAGLEGAAATLGGGRGRGVVGGGGVVLGATGGEGAQEGQHGHGREGSGQHDADGRRAT